MADKLPEYFVLVQHKDLGWVSYNGSTGYSQQVEAMSAAERILAETSWKECLVVHKVSVGKLRAHFD